MSSTLIAKIFVSVLAVTDTGSVSTAAIATDLPSETCTVLSKEFNQKTELTVQGHAVTMQIKSFCEPIGDPLAVNQRYTTYRTPPQYRAIIQDFLGPFMRE